MQVLYLIWKTFDIFDCFRCKNYLWCSKAFFILLIFIFGDILGIQLGSAVWHSKTLFMLLIYCDTFPGIYLFSENLPLTAFRDLVAKIQQTVCSIFVDLDIVSATIAFMKVVLTNFEQFLEWILSARQFQEIDLHFFAKTFKPVNSSYLCFQKWYLAC